MKNNKIQLNTSESNVPMGYTPIKILAEQYNYAVNHVAWLARTKRIDAIQRGNKGQWLVQDASLKKYHEMTLGTAVPKGYLPIRTLANKSGYAKNYLASLAKFGKIEALQDGRGRWYASERSTGQYVSDANARREESIQRGQNLFSSPGIQSGQTPAGSGPVPVPSVPPTESPVLSHESSSNAEGSPSRRNTAITLLTVLVGGILIFIFHSQISATISSLLPARPTPTKIVSAPTVTPEITPVPNPVIEIKKDISNPAPVQSHTTTNSTSIINRQVTIIQSITPEQMDILRREFSGTSQLDLSKINATLTTLTTSVGILQSITGRTAQAPIVVGNNDPSALSFGQTNFTGSVTVAGNLSNTGSFSTGAMNVSGATSISNNLTVGGNLLVNGTSGLGNQLSVTGSASVSGNFSVGNNLSVGNGITVGGSGTVGNQFSITGSASIGGRLALSKSPTIPHTGTWPSFTNLSEATLYVNALSPIADGNIFAYANNGTPKFLVDTEGDIYGNNLVLTGNTTTGTQTIAGDLTVEANSQFGDAVGDKIRFLGTVSPKTLDSVAFTIQASASQTADLFRIEDKDTNSLFRISNLGNASMSQNFEVIGYASASQYFGGGLSTCTGLNALQWDGATGKFACGASGLKTKLGNTTVSNPSTALNFSPSAFTLTASGSVETLIGINYDNGPASRSIAQTISGLWTFTNGASVSTNFEVGGYASIGGNAIIKGNLTVTGTTTNLGATTFNSGASISGNFDPGVDNTYSLGNTAYRWKDINVGPASFKMTSTTGTAGSTADYTLAQITFGSGSSLSFGTSAVGTGSGGSLALNTAGTPKLFINSGGNIGVGTTAPASKLDVRGSLGAGTSGTEFTVSTAGAVTSASTVTGTTINGTTGINTGAGAGTLRLDSAGALSNITSLAMTGAISGATTGAFSSTVTWSGGGSANANTAYTHSQDVSGAVHGATSANTINMIVRRDGSGNFSAGTISAALSGNATTATTAGTVTTAAQPNITSVGTLTSLTTSGPLYRSAAGAGYLNGQYASVESTLTSGAIYSIGGSYVPGTTTLGNMYGIGYGYSGNAGIGATGAPASLWGMYVASGGTSRIFLGSDAGNIYINGTYYGAGTGLTGTAASLTAGTATLASTATIYTDRTDGTYYQAMWATSGGTSLYSTANVTIRSSAYGGIGFNGSAWIIEGNATYGLYSNTGFDAAGGLWDAGNRVITTANIGAQSVSYASTAGSAPANGGTASQASYLNTEGLYYQGGVVGIGGTVANMRLSVYSTANDNWAMSVHATGGYGRLVAWYLDNSYIASVTTNGSTVNYETGSDYRIKENIVPMTDALSRVMQLKPSMFSFKKDPNHITYDGFIAHEAQLVYPEAVSGVKDGIDADGNIIVQGVDYSKFTPLLTGAVQELNTKVSSQSLLFDALSARVASLSLTVDSLNMLSSASMASIWSAPGFSEHILSILSGFGVIIEQGIVKVQTLIASIIQTQDLEVGSPATPAGITIYDKLTSQPVCVISENNILKSVPGKCVDSTPTPTPDVTPTPTPTPDITPSPTPTSSPTPSDTPTPTPDISPIPTPEPTISPTPTPDVTPIPTPTPSDTPTPTPDATPIPTPTPDITPTPTPTPDMTPIP